MGSYLTQPQTSTHSLGQAFAQQYKRDYGIDNDVSTQEVIHVINDALHYRQLHNGIRYLLNEGTDLNRKEFMSALEALLEKAPPVQVIYSEESTIHELQHAILNLRKSLQKHEEKASAHKQTEGQLYAAEHSISILTEENTQLQNEKEKQKSLVKIMRQQAQKLEESIANKQKEIDDLQRKLRAYKLQLTHQDA